jgi:mannose/fructose/N-acetylgalactosamine-specific phosphotransferase system component IIC
LLVKLTVTCDPAGTLMELVSNAIPEALKAIVTGVPAAALVAAVCVVVALADVAVVELPEQETENDTNKIIINPIITVMLLLLVCLIILIPLVFIIGMFRDFLGPDWRFME